MEIAKIFRAPQARFGLRWRQPPLSKNCNQSGGFAAALQSVALGDAKRK
jgi:hypothetical protein